VVLAVPPWVAADLLPGLVAPNEFQAILNIHFAVEVDRARGSAGFVGLIGGTAEWVFVKRGHVSVTISAANRMVDQSADAIAAAVWPDVRAALGLQGEMPAWRVVKERRATFAATAAQERLRPGVRTGLANLVLAGDWTATGLPATIEGAIRSGQTAAHVLLAA
jgi:hydroxysqualene dehydroxylase